MRSPKYKIIILFLFFGLLVRPSNVVHSESASELQNKIDAHNETIKKLDAEIKSYEKQVQAVGTEAKSLQSAIQLLDINQKKITAEIKKTETGIAKTNLTILELGGGIQTTQGKIDTNTLAIAETLNAMNQSDEQSLIEHILLNKSLSEILDDYESITQFQGEIRKRSNELAHQKEELSTKKTATEEEKNKLVSLKSELSDQNTILANNKKEKNNLLATTKNKEAEYKKLLTTKQADREKFEKELFEFESQLKKAVNPNSFPGSGKGVLQWPLDNVYVTQPFGSTVDSKRLYTSGTHNGVDFRASRGTPIKAALGGIVQGTGNTDAQPGCYSYGKWVLIQHPNGLSTLYGHMDLIKVTSGQQVSTGEIIGYSGQTGYATGPHLHLTLFASEGVTVQKYSFSKNCKNVSIPIANPANYLDPMKYF